jgi:hypothetical protein
MLQTKMTALTAATDGMEAPHNAVAWSQAQTFRYGRCIEVSVYWELYVRIRCTASGRIA